MGFLLSYCSTLTFPKLDIKTQQQIKEKDRAISLRTRVTMNLKHFILLSCCLSLALAYDQSCPGVYYVIRQGDTLASIASSFSYLGVTQASLVAANPNVNLNMSNLYLYYQLVCIPTTGVTGTTTSTGTTTTTRSPIFTTTRTPTNNNGGYSCSYYSVVSGDTCYDLINRYLGGQAYASYFYAANPNINCNNLQIGQSICLPVSSNNPTTTSTYTTTNSGSGSYACSRYYTVSYGDICLTIVNALRITLPNLYACNPGINGACSNLVPGQILRY